MKLEEKVPYLKTLLYVALADDSIEESELNYFNQLANMYGLSSDECEELMSSVINRKEKIEDILEGITERTTKLTLIYELIALCYADNNFSSVEKDAIATIGKLLEVEDSKVAALEEVMEENVNLQKKIAVLLER